MMHGQNHIKLARITSHTHLNTNTRKSQPKSKPNFLLHTLQYYTRIRQFGLGFKRNVLIRS